MTEEKIRNTCHWKHENNNRETEHNNFWITDGGLIITTPKIPITLDIPRSRTFEDALTLYFRKIENEIISKQMKDAGY